MCRHASVCALLLRSGEKESRIEYSISLSIVQCNTCRSPMAEAVLKDLINKKQLLNWHTDSAGLRDWNVGMQAQGRAQTLLHQQGLKTDHITRAITVEDFYNFDIIFGMDDNNMTELRLIDEQLEPPAKCQIKLLGSYLNPEQDQIIRDPYFTKGMASFYTAYMQIKESCERFVELHRDAA
ncbi:low molecular weight phosphotyrosine protein phosphatase 1 isoform X2 [Drosophila mojavensis]|uniref:acid phosphatase n=1 Tax=Drosophila mojavensis TaxID=7230 RepID=A0A0Q9WZ21_DROMO|nr:low molecular weight phosphotyrosine protein phosphatase 1 isoform X2 [Drosophila mojavensis]KRG01164.1 uncharacterized protein Dmoj_GI24422, isoform B [Drosophila mojavensis]